MLWCNSWASDPVLLVLGDSLSAGYGIKTEQGWVSLLQKKLQDSGYAFQVVNASISGETTEGGLARLPALLEQHHPNVLVIELGANDGLRGFPIKIFQDHLDALVTLGTDHHAQVLLVGVQLPLNYGPRYTNLFDQSFVDVSARHHIARAPSLLGEVPLHDELMQKDGLHPNAIAQPQLLDHVWPYLQPLLQLPLQPRLQQPLQKQAAHEH
jgi:acyl-CoA thioesterase-1